MGNVAGVLEIITMFFSFFIVKFIDQSYFLKLIRRVFMGKTKDNSIMNQKQVKKHTISNKI